MPTREEQVKKIQAEAAAKKAAEAKKKQGKAASSSAVSTKKANPFGMGGLLNALPSSFGGLLGGGEPDPMDVYGPATLDQMYPRVPYQAFPNLYGDPRQELYNQNMIDMLRVNYNRDDVNRFRASNDVLSGLPPEMIRHIQGFMFGEPAADQRGAWARPGRAGLEQMVPFVPQPSYQGPTAVFGGNRAQMGLLPNRAPQPMPQFQQQQGGHPGMPGQQQYGGLL